jgi:hypothetical protein
MAKAPLKPRVIPIKAEANARLQERQTSIAERHSAGQSHPYRGGLPDASTVSGGYRGGIPSTRGKS